MVEGLDNFRQGTVEVDCGSGVVDLHRDGLVVHIRIHSVLELGIRGVALDQYVDVCVLCALGAVVQRNVEKCDHVKTPPAVFLQSPQDYLTIHVHVIGVIERSGDLPLGGRGVGPATRPFFVGSKRDEQEHKGEG